MSKENCSEIDKIEKIRSIENDCDPSLLILMATEEPSFDVSKNENIDLVRTVSATTPATSATIKPREGNSKSQEKNPKEKIDRNNSVDSNGSNNNNKNRRKTRRGKSKRKSSKPYTKSQWSYHVPRIENMKRKVILTDIGQPLVPYNTNKFLMEDHMPHIGNSGAVAVPPSGVGTPSRTRDSSFSIDSEENYFYSLPEDEEEFLTKEFSNVYEDARCERLEAMTKAQLIQEFLQMEATVEQLTRRVNAKRTDDKSSDDRTNRTVQFLEQRIKDMAAENSDLKRKLERKHSQRNGTSNGDDDLMSTSSSEDSESDSDSSSGSSRSRSNSSDSMEMENENGMEVHEEADKSRVTAITLQ